jgi:transcriptional/translational regulatory protein YebC/TACO1
VNNGRLSTAINRAKQKNLPRANIDRAVELGASGKGAAGEDATYEGIGPGNVGIIVQCLTDNRNRTGGAVRNLFNKHGGALQESGAQAWQFDRVGCLEVEFDPAVGDGLDRGFDLLEAALECGASDVRFDDEDSDDDEFFGDDAVMANGGFLAGALAAASASASAAAAASRSGGGSGGEGESGPSVARVLCDPSDLAAVRSGLQAAGYAPRSAELVWEPKAGSPLLAVDPASENGVALAALLGVLEDHDDVMHVFHNAK